MNKIQEDSIFEGTIEFTNSGNASIKINEKSIFIFRKNTLNALNLDKVKVVIIKNNKKIEAQVIEVIERFRTKFVGKVQINKGLTFVVPDSQKMPVDFFIKGEHNALHDQKVLVEIINWEPDTKSPKAKIIEILGNSGENNAEMNSIMYEYGLPNEFPLMVEAEAELISFDIPEEEIAKRRDMRNITTFTIDPVDAKDFDDALSVNILDDNSVEIGIHIADVSHYIKEGSDIDAEAVKRATSVYLVDRCVPMLPERLSNGVCSLRPNEDKLCFSVVVILDKKGNIISKWFGKTVIHSDKRFSYEQAQEIIEDEQGDKLEYGREIKLLDSIAKVMRKQRIKEGSIEMGGIEVRFTLDEVSKKPIGVHFKVQKDSNKLIEEYMLLANKLVAKQLSDAKYHNVYRIHDTPNIDKLMSLSLICKNFGYSLDVDENTANLKQSINQLVADIKDTPEENMIETLITRCMSKATYTIKNTGHYGLGFTHYSHFTSPIRRYPDLITHRVLMDFLDQKANGNPNKIEQMAKWCSEREVLAARAERDSIKYKQIEYLQDKIGQVFEGIVSGVTDWGMYVELIENKCEGMIRYTPLHKVDAENYVVYTGDGKAIRLGDTINVKVRSVDLDKKQIDFDIF